MLHQLETEQGQTHDDHEVDNIAGTIGLPCTLMVRNTQSAKKYSAIPTEGEKADPAWTSSE